MRPECATSIINKAFHKFMIRHEWSKGLGASLDMFSTKQMRQAVDLLLKKYMCEEKLHYKNSIYSFSDKQITQILRPMYEDETSYTQILDRLHYISDRWGCSGRLGFLKRVIYTEDLISYF